MNEVRVTGDPFGDDPCGHGLRGFLRLCAGSDMRCSLSVPAAALARQRQGDRDIALHDGHGMVNVRTSLPASEIELLQRAIGQAVSSTAPVVVFAPVVELRECTATAGLQWPNACKVIPAYDHESAAEQLARVRAELRWAGTEDPEHGVDESELLPWLLLSPPPPASQLVLHVTDGDPADGTDVLLTVFAQSPQLQDARLCVLLTEAPEGIEQPLQAIAIAAGGDAVLSRIEFVRGELQPEALASAAVLAQPLRLLRDSRTLVQLLASGRPLCLSRHRATASLVAAPGVCLPIGGRWLPAENGAASVFEPDPRALLHALHKALSEAKEAVAVAARARAHVRSELTNDRPASPPPPPASPRSPRPRVVLEAPYLETSSSAELSLATAAALLARGNVDLQLVATAPFHTGLAALRARAPMLASLLTRRPADTDLWVSSGWPVRTARPPCRSFALRVDYEYGALPVELCPAVTQECDRVLVHSAHVFRTVMAAGRVQQDVLAVPHGVDGDVFHEAREPLREVMEWKRGRPAVLFVGGLVFRKGIDVLLKAILAAGADAPFGVVIKPVGGDSSYRGFHLGELVERVSRTKGAPPVLVLDRDLSRAEMAALFCSCDLLLHPYRGEGFGMPVLEARACGLPVMVTEGGATDDFCQGPGVVRIPSQRRSLSLPTPHLSQPWLLEPDGDAAGRLLLDTLANLPAIKTAARAVAPAVRAAYTWDSAAEAIEKLAFAALGQRRVPLRAPASVPAATV